MTSRKEFLRQGLIGTGLLATAQFPWQSLASTTAQEKLLILHTNDVHSHLEPFPSDGGKYAGQGGLAARASLIKKLRSENEHVLLFDSGDIFQGTPYFNMYKGEPEIKAMSLLKYDAGTMGNHDFDAGVEGFAQQLPHANFPMLCSNYDFTGTALEGKTQPYTIIKKGEIKVGVFGLGIRLKGLVSDKDFEGTTYLDPIRMANKTANILKRKGCHLIICLSHLGYSYSSRKVSDLVLAKETENIDLILGGHTHTFLDRPEQLKNKKGQEVVVNQVGWAGLRLGQIHYEFGHKKNVNLSKSVSVILDKETIG